MTTRPAQSAATSIFRRFHAAIANAYTAFDRERRVRITTDHLHRLSDHSLRDIGLSRDNIEQVIRDKSVHW